MIRTVVVDDSPLAQQAIACALGACPDIVVVGCAGDPYTARDMILTLNPDVVTLDIEMPRMNGLSFLAKLMKHRPMPVVIVSAITGDKRELAGRALSLGSTEVVNKPASSSIGPEFSRRLAHAVRAAAASHISRLKPDAAPACVVPRLAERVEATCDVIAIGASTGGVGAVQAVLGGLPADAPGVVIAQHMPEHYTAAFAGRLNDFCPMQVTEAQDGEELTSGRVLIAPGGKHILLHRSGSRLLVKIKDGPAVHYQRPSVDVLFYSVARNVGSDAVGVLLTGMGSDGAAGLLAMRNSGAHTLAQDEETSVVFGMPAEAIKIGAASQVLPISEISPAILAHISQARKAA